MKEQERLSMLERPDCNFSLAASRLTGNLAAGLVIYAIKKFEPCGIKKIADECYLTERKVRAAVSLLEEAELIECLPRPKVYEWKGDHPEQVPYMYIMTDEGHKFAPRSTKPEPKQTTSSNHNHFYSTPSFTEKKEEPKKTPEWLKPLNIPSEEEYRKQITNSYDGEAIATECGLLDRSGELTLSGYMYKTKHLTPKQKEALDDFINKKTEA